MKETSRYTTWLHKRTTAERAAMAYATFGTTELIPHLHKLTALRFPRPTRFNVTVGVSAALLVGLPTIGGLLSPQTVETVTPVVTSARVSKWKNPNIKPFAESPYMDYGKVEWDEEDQQWRCEVERGGTTPCSNTEGKTAEQLKEDGAQARVDTARFQAEREAQERALNEYWCGPFEDPKKTGCNSL